MAEHRDALGLTRFQRGEAEERERVNPAEVKVVNIAVDPAGAEITDTGRSCPAAVPCLGRTGVGIVAPVMQTNADGTKQKVGEIPATYCPNCGGWKTDARVTS